MAGQACRMVRKGANFSMPWRRNSIRAYRMYVLNGSHEKMNQQILFLILKEGEPMQDVCFAHICREDDGERDQTATIQCWQRGL